MQLHLDGEPGAQRGIGDVTRTPHDLNTSSRTSSSSCIRLTSPTNSAGGIRVHGAATIRLALGTCAVCMSPWSCREAARATEQPILK
jgi:hypothetical protein